MKYEVETAKNGELTLKINGSYIYSKYAPQKDAQTFIRKEFEENAEGYLLVGIGLGYHLNELLNHTIKPIIVLPLDKQDLTIYIEHCGENNLDKVTLFLSELDIDLRNYQVLLPGSFLNAIGEEHPLYDFLLDIKIRQRSFKTYSELLERNLKTNISLGDPLHFETKDIFVGREACLVAAGPSLDQLIDELEIAQSKGVYILCVGSALKVLLHHHIKPDAVIITDSQDHNQFQLKDTTYDGTLFYLCTANDKTVALHRYKRVMLLQQGYDLEEQFANTLYSEELIETGGSVATTAFSLLEFMGFQTVYLFGQDLGFSGDFTHSAISTSGSRVETKKYRQIESNDGKLINTLPNLYSYLRWFEQKFNKSNVQVYNLALNGAKINNAKFISTEEFKLNLK